MLTIESELCMHGQFRSCCHVYKLPKSDASPNKSMVRPHTAAKALIAKFTHLTTYFVGQGKRNKKKRCEI